MGIKFSGGVWPEKVEQVNGPGTSRLNPRGVGIRELLRQHNTLGLGTRKVPREVACGAVVPLGQKWCSCRIAARRHERSVIGPGGDVVRQVKKGTDAHKTARKKG